MNQTCVYDVGMHARSAFHERLNAAAGGASYRELGDLTQTHPETVRRYMHGQAPSAAFITNLCHAKGISGHWLLSGQGPMRTEDLKTHALKNADPNELMGAVANILSDLIERVDRLERLIQTIETRVHASGTLEHKGVAPVGSGDDGPALGPRPDGDAGERIGRAVPERSSRADQEDP